jgi:GTP-binding protein
MKKPLVSIVGRPNVGKSTFFNRVIGKKISIVQDTPGVTRDRVYGDAEWNGYAFSLVDTGGLDFENKEIMMEQIINQAKIAVDLSDVILFFVDGKTGLNPSDYEVANFLRKSGKPIILVVNKLDNYEVENSYEFYQLKLGDPMCISAEQGKGTGDVLDKVVSYFKEKVDKSVDDKRIKIAVVGKPNAGKSSLTNKLLNDDRMIVTDIAGTTRDAIDTPFSFDGKDYLIIDTAGMRKKNAIEMKTIESYSILRSVEAIKSADVVLLVIDSTQGISDQDLKIGALIQEENKPVIIVMNKWDLINKAFLSMKDCENALATEFAFMKYYKSVYISAKTGQKVQDILPLINQVYENANRTVQMGVLNEIISDAIGVYAPPSRLGKRLKVIYATQASTNPPKFLIFCNDSNLAVDSYTSYIENKLREAFDFSGTPIKIIYREKSEKDDD